MAITTNGITVDLSAVTVISAIPGGKVATVGNTYYVSRSGRSFQYGKEHVIGSVGPVRSDGSGYTARRLTVEDGGWFDDLHESGWEVGDKFVEMEGTNEAVFGRTDYVKVQKVANNGGTTQQTQGAQNMVGQVYSAAVVRTKTVAAGEGVNTGVQVSEVVSTKSGFIATNDENAKAIALAEAIVEAKGALNVNDPTQPIEVKLNKFA